MVVQDKIHRTLTEIAVEEMVGLEAEQLVMVLAVEEEVTLAAAAAAVVVARLQVVVVVVVPTIMALTNLTPQV